MKKFTLFSFSVSPQSETDNNGIIHHFPSIPVETYASSVYVSNNATYGPQHVIDPSESNWWISVDLPGQWVVINFTEHQIFVSHYGIKSHSYAINNLNPKQWKVSGYQNGIWTDIDEVTTSKINGPFLTETRSISNNGPFSAFRFMNTGRNWYSPDSYYYFAINNIDFFGNVFSPSDSHQNTSPQNPTIFLCFTTICKQSLIFVFSLSCLFIV